jgi:hypothetical protein
MLEATIDVNGVSREFVAEVRFLELPTMAGR